MKKLILPVLLLTITFSMLSCSYGLFNFSSETGDLEADFQLSGDNAPGVDQLIYEFTPPDGSGLVSFSEDLSGTIHSYTYIDRMTAGTWAVTVKLMAGGSLFQSYSGSFDIYTGGQTSIQVDAAYNGADFDIYFNWYLGDSGSTGTGVTAFTVSNIYLNPNLYLSYNTGEFSASANFEITGSGLDSQVRNVELLYPDGLEIYFGEQYYYRAVIYSHSSENSLIRIERLLQTGPVDVNGEYVLKMRDYNGNGIRQALSVDYGDLDPRTPRITGMDYSGDVPDYVMNTIGHTFQWELADSSLSGTILLFVVDVNSPGNIYPATDAEIITAGISGELSIGPAVISDGEYELIIAAIEKPFTTPIADALAAGLSPDLRPAAFSSSVRSIYGSDTGLIAYSSVRFTYSP